MRGFAEFGGKAAPAAVSRLLQRHGIPASAVSLIGHQASAVLFEMWKQVIQPAQIIETIETFANMTIANIAVNFAWSAANNPITQDNLVLLALAPDMHANALLLQRDQPAP
jgi:3-oxoacyl-[acyl-carrier-protein] synthase III